jgi:dTMP kinase
MADLLTRRNVPVLATREPGGTPLGTKVRALLLDFSGQVDPGAELLLMFADRTQHLVEEIEPALARGLVVLCDRYTDASRAYQGAGRRLGEETVDDLHRRFCGREPDRTYLFDCPVPIALARIARRGDGNKDRIERESAAFHRRVRAAYRLRAASEPKRFRVLDATRPEEVVFEEVERDLNKLLARRERKNAR